MSAPIRFSRCPERQIRYSRLALCLAGTLVLSLSGCGGGGGGGTPRPAPTATPNPLTVSRVEVTASRTQTEAGQPLTLSATPKNAIGGAVAGVMVAWSVADPAQARIDSAGELIAFTPGTVEVRATSGGIVGRFTVTITAGTGSWGAGRLYGSDNNEGGENIVVDAAGNVYVAGSTAGTLDRQSAEGASDAFVTRYLPDGARAWTVLIPTPAIDGANGLALHPSGGVVVGAGNAFGGKVTRLDAAGRAVWTRELSGAGIAAVATDAAGNVFVAGDALRASNPGINSIVGPPLGEINTGGASDGFLIKLNASGSPVWGKLYTWISPDQSGARIPAFSTSGTDVTVDEPRGAIYVCGATQANAFYGLSAWARRFDLNGQEQWSRFLNKNGVAVDADSADWDSNVPWFGGMAHTLTVGTDGSVYVGGSFDEQKPFVVALSDTGSSRWRRDLAFVAEGVEEAILALTFRPAQNDIIAVAGLNGPTRVRSNYLGNVLLRLTAAGTPDWQTTVPVTPAGTNTSAALSIRDITASASGELFAVGDTAGNFAGFINAGTATGFGGTDLAIVHRTVNGQ